MEWKNLFKKVFDSGKKKSPEILTSFVLLGVVATAYYSYKAGLKSDAVLEYHKNRKEELRSELIKTNDMATYKKEVKELNKETTKKIAPVVAPAVVMGAITMGCAVGSNMIHSKRIAVLSAAYTLSERTLSELNKKMTSTLGEKKTKEIKDAVVQERILQNPPKDYEIINTGYGDVLCMDYYSGRYFRSSAQKIGEAVNELSSRIISEMYVSLNDFYELLNVPRVPMGEDFGWSIDDTDRGRLPISFDSAVLTADNRPCLSVEYDIRPRDDFRNLH